MKAVLPCCLLVVSLAGCGTARRTQQPAIHIRDSVAVHYEERHVTVFDTVPVTLPQESSITQTLDTVSHIETSVAESDAWITPGGVLHHTLKNKPSLPVVIPRDTVYITNDSIVYKERETETPPQQPQEQKPSFLRRLANSITDVLALIGAATLLAFGIRLLQRRILK